MLEKTDLDQKRRKIACFCTIVDEEEDDNDEMVEDVLEEDPK